MCRRGARKGNQVRSRLAGGGSRIRTLSPTRGSGSLSAINLPRYRRPCRGRRTVGGDHDSGNRVRTRLPAGAKGIRTRGPTAIASSVSGPCWSISSRARATHSRAGCGVRTTLVPESNRRSPCQPAPELPSGPSPISTHGRGVARQAAGGSHHPTHDRRPDRP
jgi:hypothetical protein